MENIKATFPAGTTEVTVRGLHQWDYGRKLEIHDASLPAMVEVHFATAGMEEAVVRACESVSGVATAVIPDSCLEQTAPVYAWVYVIDDTTGATVKTVTMPVTARTKPQPGATVPDEIVDRYTEALTEMNAAVAKVQRGEVNAMYALNAQQAEMADEAGYADHAMTADKATVADAVSALYLHQYRITVPLYADSVGTTQLGRADLFVEYSDTKETDSGSAVASNILYSPNKARYTRGFLMLGAYYNAVDRVTYTGLSDDRKRRKLDVTIYDGTTNTLYFDPEEIEVAASIFKIR